MKHCLVLFVYLIGFYRNKADQHCDRRTNEQQQTSPRYVNINDINSYSPIYTPAEINDMDAIWIGWPKYDYKETHFATQTVINMIKALCNTENDHDNIISTQVIVQAPPDIYNDAVDKLTSEGLLHCVQFNHEFTDEIWLRDIGPVFTYYNTDLIVIDFDFDMWSGSVQAGVNATAIEESLDRLIYYNEAGISTIINTCLIGEGGNREFNGDGILMMNQNVEEFRNVDRTLYNTQWTLKDSEMEYKKLFNIDKIIWLKGIMWNDQLVDNPSYGPCTGCIAFGWGTGGHIDEIARFVDQNTIVILKITDNDIERDEYSNGQLEEEKELMDDNIEYLKQNFDDLTIIEIPLAPSYWVQITDKDNAYDMYIGLPEFDELVANDQIIYLYGATSYLNFVITNQAVLIPSYYIKDDIYLGYEWIKERDEEVLQIMKELFEETGRQVIQINPINVNIGGGGMHCITRHKPSNPFLSDDINDSPDEPSCVKVTSYDSGATNTDKCPNSGETYCESSGECLPSGSENTCAVCPSDKPTYCQLLGARGGKCCDFLDDMCTNYDEESADGSKVGAGYDNGSEKEKPKAMNDFMKYAHVHYDNLNDKINENAISTSDILIIFACFMISAIFCFIGLYIGQKLRINNK